MAAQKMFVTKIVAAAAEEKLRAVSIILIRRKLRSKPVRAECSKIGRLTTSRGVAQPGRAPGSGPGGRRFKSSLPDQSFSRSFSCLGGYCRFSFFGTFRYIRGIRTC